MSTHEQARKALGQLFVVGFNGLELPNETASFISQANIGGVILFGPNYENPGQVAELSNQVQECRIDMPLWVAVDHEGGRVQRFKKPFTKIPEAAVVGITDSPKLAFELSEVVAKELRAVGVNLNFAPVADIATNPKNPVIGPRAYGPSEDLVSKMVSAIVRGHCVHGVQPCVKHFPGHGDSATDSHFALPKVDTPIEVLNDREFRPFVKAFKSRCGLVMTGHIMMPKLDPKFPATLSKEIITEILRKQLRFSKVVVTDDMEMKAITDHFGADEAPRLAIEAGCDMLVYRTENAARHAYEVLVKALEDGTLPPERILESETRVRLMKKESIFPYQAVQVAEVGKIVGIPEHQAVVTKIEELAKARS